MRIVFTPTAKLMRGWQANEDYLLALIPDNESFGTDSNITPTIRDVTYAARTTTATISKNRIGVTTAPDAPVMLTTDTPNVCTVAADGSVSRIADGACIINARGRTGSRKISQTISQTGGSTIYDAVTARAAGSLRKYLYDQQIAALAGVTPGAAAQRAHVYGSNLAAGNGTSNTMSGAHGTVNSGNFLRRSGVAGFAGFPLDILDSVLATGGATVESRVWLTPRHYITGLGKAHGKTAGATYRLVGQDAVIYYSTTPWAGTLAKVLPADYKTKLPNLADAPAPDSPSVGNLGSDFPCWARLYNTYVGSGSDPAAERRWVQPVNFWLAAFTSADSRFAFQKQNAGGGSMLANGGDSGSPVFVGINGHLVILSHVTYQGVVGTDDYGLLASDINAAMNNLASTQYGDNTVYAVQTVDLSGFTSYP